MNNLERASLCDRSVNHICYAASKVKSWFNPETVDGRKIRSLILATLATIVIGEISAYRIIKQDIISGELNIFTLDFVIIGVSVVEVLVGPFLSWLGYDNRRFLILGWNFALAGVSLLWLAMPTAAEIVESEYCNENNAIARVLAISPQASVRLTMMILSSIVFCLTRVVVWSHGIAYIDEHAPNGISLHFGILIAFRVVALIVFNKIILNDKSVTMQVLALVGSTIGNILQVILFMPRNLPPPEQNPDMLWDLPRDFVSTMGRVTRNTLALTQMIGIGLLAAALWGFAYHNDDIVMVKHHLDLSHSDGIGANIGQILRYLVVVIAVVYVGVRFSPPILAQFSNLRAVKQATLMAFLSFVFYILLITLGYCDQGYVAGLGKSHYVSPDCNADCGCVPGWRGFSPVCVLDQITTYLSPCHAGCSNSESLNNIRVFINCTCAPGSGRASIGACSFADCSRAYDLHQALFILVVMATVLAFQAKGLLMLQAVDTRDRSLVLGVAGAVVASITFGVGHLIFLGISAASCRWFEEGRCHLQSHLFPTYIGSASAVMVFLSLCISIATWIGIKRAQREKYDEDNGQPEEAILMNDTERN